MARFGTSSMGMPPKISFTTRPFLGESCAFTAAASGEPVRSRWTATRYCNKDRKQGCEGKLCSFRGLSLRRILVRVLLSGAIVRISIPGRTQIISPENSARPRKTTSPRLDGKSQQRYTNRLIHEKSPYLLLHAHNPVDWYPWGEEAFAKAKREKKPIFLSIGYSTCHWCHVMESESFENEEIAAFMNSRFVNIKVDREERPDVDRVYMTFVQATAGGGGWPLNVWLTPALKPFVGGTYFPPEDRHGQPSFGHVMQRIAAAWKQNH